MMREPIAAHQRGAVAALACAMVLASAGLAHAQYVQRQVVTTSGAITFVGNTLGLNKDAGDDEPGISGSIGTFITTDTSRRDNSDWPFGTTEDWRENSSSAQLKLPAASRVIYAELIWGGSYDRGGEDVTNFLNTHVTLTTPTGTSSVSPDPNTRFILTGSSAFYTRSADVTALIVSGGNGAYTVGGVPATQATSEDNFNVAGWTLAILYENFSLPSRNLSLFVGLESENGASASVSGFCTPTGSAAVRGRVAVSAVEGDTHLDGDTMRFGPSSNLNSNRFRLSGPNNGLTNFFAAQINGDDGRLVTTGTFGNRNNTFNSPHFEGGRQGWDITNVDASAQLENGQTEAFVRGTSDQEGYAINALALQIDVGAPRFAFEDATTVSAATATVGTVLTYTVRLDNSDGQADATNVVFQVPLPTGTSFVGGSLTVDGSGRPGDPTTGVPIGTVAAGATRVVTFKLRVDGVPAFPAPASIEVTPSWTYNYVSCGGQPSTSSSFSTASVVTGLPRVDAVKQASPSPVRPNELLTYGVLLRNTGLAATTGTLVTDAIPAGTTYVAGSTRLNNVPVPDVGGIAPVVAGLLVNGTGFPPGVLDPAAVALVNFQVRVNPTQTASLVNTAMIDPDGPSGPQPPFAVAVTTPVTPAADVSVTKAGPATVVAGTDLTYTIEVQNNGPAAAADVSLANPTPTGLSLVSVAGACTAFPCTLGTLASGATRTVTVTYRVPPSYTTPDPIVNIATVSSPTADPLPNNNTAAASTALGAPVADLQITKTNNQTSVVPGTTTTYVIVVTNDGPNNAPGSRIRDSFPSSMTGVTWTCTASGGAQCGNPSGAGDIDETVDVPDGGTITFTAAGTIDTAVTGELTNVASASPSSTIADSTPAIATDRDPLMAQADVAVSIDAPATAVPGTPITYTIRVTNNGPSATAGDIFGSNPIPAGLTFRSVTGDCTEAPCNLGILAPGATRVAQVTFDIPIDFADATIVDITHATIGADDPNSANNEATATTTIVHDADVSVVKTVEPDSAQVGDSVTFSITVHNDGPAPATGVIVTDLVPAGLTVTFSETTIGSYSQQTGVWSVGTLLSGESEQLTIVAIVGQAGTLTNLTTTSHQDQPDPDTSNNSAEATVNGANGADLGVVKTVDNPNPTAGQDVTFTVTVTNQGPNSASGVEITDALPAGYTLVSATPSQGTYTAPMWSVGVLDERGVATLSIVATATTTSAVVNTAVKSTQVEPDFNPVNDRSSVTLNGAGTANLAVGKTVSSPIRAVGETVTFTVVVTNLGPSDATGIEITDVLPVGLTYVSSTSSQGSYDPGSGAWMVGAVAVSRSAVLSITAAVADAGVLTNTASVAASDQPDPEPTNDTASATVTSAATADLSIEKTQVGQVTPGLPARYRIVVRNSGPSPVADAEVADTFPVTVSSVSWICGADPGSACGAASGTGNLATTVDLAPGGSVTFTATGQIDPLATGTLDNTATVTAPAGLTDPNLANNSSSVTTPLTPLADVRVTKSGPSGAVVAGTTVTFTIIVSNAGPSVATDVTVADPTPTGLTFVPGGGTCGAGFPCILGALAPGASVSFTADFAIPPAYTTPDPIVNVASVSTTTLDPAQANNTATAAAAIGAPLVNLQITKDDGATALTPGSPVTYTITVTNAGPSIATDAVVTDTFPPEITGVTWTCAGAGGGTCPASGSGSISATVTIPPAGSVVFTATGTVSPSAAGQVINTASAVPGAGVASLSSGNATDSDTVDPLTDLSITKTGPASAVTGASVIYTLTVNNAGPSSAEHVSVADPTPAGLTFVANAGDCTTAFPCALGTIPSGETRTITATFHVPPGYTSPSPIVNTAVVSASTDDPVSTNNSASFETTLIPDADIEISKVAPVELFRDGTATVVITARNLGPNPATGVEVTDRLPAGTEFLSADESQGTYDPLSGLWSVGGLNVGNAAQLSIVVRRVAPLPITNLAMKTGQNEPDLNPANDSASASAGVPTPADLAVEKTVDLPDAPGGSTVTFTVKVTNRGPSAATSVTIDDTLPAGLTLVSATPSQGTYAAGVWTVGSIDVLAQATLTIAATVDAPGAQVNNAAVGGLDQADPNPLNDRAAVSVNAAGTADIAVSKAVSSATPAVGTQLTYTVTARNLGPAAATGVVVADLLPAGVAFVSATASQGTYDQVSGEWSVGAMPLDAAELLSITARVTAPGATVNTASRQSSAPADPNPDNDSSDATFTAAQISDLTIVKTPSRPAAAAGTSLTWTIVVTNNGPSGVADATVSDAFPAAFTGATWTCAASAGSSCGAASGTGSIATTVSLAAGGTATFTATGLIDVAAAGLLSNVASVTVPAGVTDPDETNNTNTSTVLTARVAALQVTKVGSSVVTPGTSASYTINVLNNGPSEATAVVLDDPAPPGLTVALVSGACTALPCSLGTLQPGESRDVGVVFAVPATYTGPSPIVNVATAASDSISPRTGGEQDSAETDVVASADLSVTKTGPASVASGQPVTYTITVSNDGPSAASDVVLDDPLPSGLVAGTVSGDCSALPCTVGALLPNESRSVDVTFVVPPGYTTPNPIVNTATVTASTPDPDSANNSASATTAVAAVADVAVMISGTAAVVPGADVVYTVTVTNAGPSDAIPVTVDVPTPAGLTFVSNTGDCATAFPCAFVSMPAGTTLTITATYTVPVGYTTPDPITVRASAVTVTPDPDTANNTATAETVLNLGADVEVTMSAAAIANVGDTIDITVNALNHGPNPATSVAITDLVPAGFLFVSAAPAQGSYDSALGLWSVGTMAVNGTAQLVLTVAVAAPGSIANVAVKTRQIEPDPNTSNDSAAVVINGGTVADVSVTKTVDLVTANVGDTVTFAVTAANRGPGQATGVAIADALPPGLSLVSATPSQGSYATGTWTIGTMAPGVSTTLTVVGTVSAPGAMVNNGALSAQTEVDPNPLNNSSAVAVNAPADAADLLVAKTASNLTPDVGSAITYTVTVANLGVADASGVVIADLLPAGLTFVSSVASHGSYDEIAGLWTVGDIPATETALLAITADVTQASTIVNTASRQSSVSTDPNAANDSASVTIMPSNSSDLAVSKTASAADVGLGSTITWTIVVTNTGPSEVTGAMVTDAVPAGLLAPSWTCVAAAGASCSAASGTGSIASPVDIAAGSSVTFVMIGTVGPSGTATLVNTASATTGTSGRVDPSPGNNSATSEVSIAGLGGGGSRPPRPSPPSGPSDPGAPPPPPPVPNPGCDINGDGTPEIVTGAGPGGGPHVRVGTMVAGAPVEIAGFFAYDPAFMGGVTVACADLTGDGVPEIVTGAGPGGAPHVRVWRLADGGFVEIVGFLAYDPNFSGGVTVAANDVNGDGLADIVTGAAPGGGPHVRVWTLAGGGLRELAGAFALPSSFKGGVSVASADVTGDGIADVIAGAGPGELAVVRVFSNQSGETREVTSFLAYGEPFKGGVLVAAADLTGDGVAEIVTGAAPGGGPHVRIFQWTGREVTLLDEFFAYDADFTGGVTVAATAFNGAYAEIVTGAGTGGGPHVRVWRFDGKAIDRGGFFAYDSDFTGGVFVATGNLPPAPAAGPAVTSPQPTSRQPSQPATAPSPAMAPATVVLSPGDSMASASGRYVLIYQYDSNLVLYAPNGAPLWSSGTNGLPAGVTVLQGDGNLVVYDAGGNPRWSSGTAGNPGARLLIQDDGRVVVYSSAGNAIWATPEVRPSSPAAVAAPSPARQGGAGVMEPGSILNPNESVTSTDGRYVLVYQSDGNLVLHEESGSALWSSGTAGTTPGIAAMQGDGNVVVYDAGRNAVWASGTEGHANARLFVQNDGNVVIYESGGSAVWSTNTAR